MISRSWAMPNKWTFRMSPVKLIFDKYVHDLGANWADPFCGQSMTAQYRNDLDPSNKFANYNMEAKDFLNQFKPNTLCGVLFDPPYSPRQISECYKSIGKKVKQKDTQNQWTKEKNLIAEAIKP